MAKSEKERIEEVLRLQRERRAKVFLISAIEESVELFGCAGAKEILEDYVEYLEEFV